jgi:hypothetical protein
VLAEPLFSRSAPGGNGMPIGAGETQRNFAKRRFQ